MRTTAHYSLRRKEIHARKRMLTRLPDSMQTTRHTNIKIHTNNTLLTVWLQDKCLTCQLSTYNVLFTYVFSYFLVLFLSSVSLKGNVLLQEIGILPYRKEEEEKKEKGTFILTAKWSRQHRALVVFRHSVHSWFDLIIAVRCWQADGYVVCDLIYSDIQACLLWEV